MDLEQRIQKIEERNLRVEADKAWEKSALRVSSIMLVTYLIAFGVLVVIGNDNALRNALIPTLGYFLSVQSLPFLKQSWVSRYLERRSK